MNFEIILYRPNKLAEHIEVRLEDETVWLNRQQLSLLFKRDVKTIGKHVSIILKEELASVSVVANFATTASDGKIYQTEYYNLDMIISVGYRIKSIKGIQFRIWASKVLKEYLLKGYSINNRVNRLENHFDDLKIKINEIELHISSHLIPHQGVFFEGQVFDAYELASIIIRSAKSDIILIDNYINESTLLHLTKKVKVLLLTKTISDQSALDVKKANEQFSHIEIKSFAKSHDHFLIIDNTEVYHLGASLKDLGKKWFAFSKMDKSSVAFTLNTWF
jgi:hypothetical protein